jgi:HSP20 family protein
MVTATIRDQVNTAYDDAARCLRATTGESRWLGESCFALEMDAVENSEGYVITFDIPGVERDDISVKLDGHLLTVSGYREQPVENEARGEFVRLERRMGPFKRIVALPRPMTASMFNTRYANGVLIVTIPKSSRSARGT